MNAAEKAAQARNREQDARIMKVFEEAQKYHADYSPDTIGYTLEYKIKSANAKKKAVKLYKQCAKLGHTESMECLADIFNKSNNAKKAVYWYQRAAENGGIDGMSELIWRYESGYGGVVKSEATALKWKGLLQSRIKELFEEAMQNYTECKENFDSYANGAESDAAMLKSEDRQLLESAISILTKCSKHDVRSIEVLGEIYKDWMHDKKQTFYWFEEGAKRGSTLCMHTLGVFYRDGIGTNPDSYMSRHYFDMEKRAGNKI